MLRRIVLPLVVLLLLTGAFFSQDKVSITKKELIGRWGRVMYGLQEVSYTEFVLKANGAYVLSGKSFSQDFKETGTWTLKNNVLTLKIKTVSGESSGDKPGMIMQMNISRERGIIYAIQEPSWRWAKGVHWDFKREAYYDDKGNRLKFVN